MVDEVGGVVTCVLLDQVELQLNVFPGGDVVVVEVRRVCGVKSVSHVDTVQPHLVGVGWGTVPETALGCARPAVQLVPVPVGGDLVLGLLAAALVPPVENVVAHTDIVQGVVCVVVASDSSIGRDKGRHGTTCILEQILIVVHGSDLLDTLKCNRGNVGVTNDLVLGQERRSHPC